jgi:hypothetical protein
MSSQVSRLISLGRLRTYEAECRRQAATSGDLFSRTELTKLADTFRQSIIEIKSTCDFETPPIASTPHAGHDPLRK